MANRLPAACFLGILLGVVAGPFGVVFERPAVEKQRVAAHLHRVAQPADHAFDQPDAVLGRQASTISPRPGSDQWARRCLAERNPQIVCDLVHIDQVAVENRGVHPAGRHPVPVCHARFYRNHDKYDKQDGRPPIAPKPAAHPPHAAVTPVRQRSRSSFPRPSTAPLARSTRDEGHKRAPAHALWR